MSICMDAEDPRIKRAYEMKMLQEFSVREIALELSISEPRVYQLISKARTIVKKYRAVNG